MNTNNNHLVSSELYNSLQLSQAQAVSDAYTPVPARLARAAARKLGKRKEAFVSFTSGGKLSKWAAEQRAERRAQERRAEGNAARKRKNRQAQEKRTRKAQRRK